MNYLKFISAFMICSLLFFTSCSDDDDNDTNPQSTESIKKEDLLGKWVWTASTYDGTVEPLTDCDKMHTIEFTNSQFKGTEYWGDNCEFSEDETSGYTLTGNKLVISFGGENYTVEVKSVSNTTLVLVEKYDGSEFVDTYTKQ